MGPTDFNSINCFFMEMWAGWVKVVRGVGTMVAKINKCMPSCILAGRRVSEVMSAGSR